jgi:hypothetical protein
MTIIIMYLLLISENRDPKFIDCQTLEQLNDLLVAVDIIILLTDQHLGQMLNILKDHVIFVEAAHDLETEFRDFLVTHVL